VRYLLDRARSAEPDLTTIVREVADRVGGTLVGLDERLKNPDSISDKLTRHLRAHPTDSLATGYTIERSVGGSAFAQVGKVTKKTYSDSGLAANTTYTYRVIATSSAGSSAPSATASATTKNKAPAAPTGLTATAISSSQINLAWSTSDTLATSYFVERSLNGNSFTKIATVTATSFSDTGLTASTTYTYRVTASNAIGNSPASSKVSATTKVKTPAAPINLAATVIGSTQINLAWSTSDSLATGYIIERSIGTGAFAQIASVTTKSYSNTGLTPGTTYNYRVTATNSGGSSAPSTTVTARTTANLPAAPTGVTATAASISQINLTWTTTDALATGYIVERSQGGGAFTQIANVVTKSYNNTGLIEGATYSYRITSYNASGSSAPSATATATTLQRPAVPTNLVATAASISQINLTWTTTDALATGYIVERSQGGGAFADVTSGEFPSDAESFAPADEPTPIALYR